MFIIWLLINGNLKVKKISDKSHIEPSKLSSCSKNSCTKFKLVVVSSYWLLDI